jgi:hypothetical protein
VGAICQNLGNLVGLGVRHFMHECVVSISCTSACNFVMDESRISLALLTNLVELNQIPSDILQFISIVDAWLSSVLFDSGDMLGQWNLKPGLVV